ncbi:MAG: ArnT family glycosyltransferase [Phocaeicola sp.]|uniref:ArnT family glycosyltransferase n=1 Tax=Phocaeicola sp. TaxID=2773926 RepID=UPI003FA0CEDE
MKRYIWIILLCIAAFFVHNGALQTDIMESRNIVTAREMVSEGNWLIPTMNGELRLEKPPLPTWVAGFIEKVAPDNLKAQRSAAGVMGIIWVLFFYLTAKEIFRKKDYAFIATLIFLTCYNIILMGRTATWDIYCHAFMMGAIFFLWKGLYDDPYREKSRPWRNFTFAGIFMGLSFLSKGPVSFYALLLPFIIAALVYRRPLMRGKWKAFIFMIIVCVILSAWWYLYIIAFHPEAANAVIEKESGSWINHNVRPWWYYWRFFAETGVWALLTLSTLFISHWKKVIYDRRGYLFTIWWMLAALVLLSFMPEKKMRYLLPMMVPCSYAVAFLVYHFYKEYRLDKTSKLIFYINAGLVSLIATVLPVLIFIFGYQQHRISLITAIVAGMLILVIAIWLWKLTARLRSIEFVFGIVALFVVAECFLFNMIGASFTNPEFNSIRGIREVNELKGVPLYYNELKGPIRMELVYEAHRKILPLDFENKEDVLKALPCAVVTIEPIKNEFPKEILNMIDTTMIGIYDDNRHPKGTKHYHEEFLNQVTLLKLK